MLGLGWTVFVSGLLVTLILLFSVQISVWLGLVLAATGYLIIGNCLAWCAVVSASGSRGIVTSPGHPLSYLVWLSLWPVAWPMNRFLRSYFQSRRDAQWNKED